MLLFRGFIKVTPHPLRSNMSAMVPRGFPMAWGDLGLIKGITYALKRCRARWFGPVVRAA